MATKIKGLQQWCKRMTDGYANVDVVNFTTAWRNGLAFCALIHRFRPDLIDYDALSPENVFDNCKLAFEVAEKELDIPAFLEAEDMARLKVPDKLSIITYVSQYYNYLGNLPQLGGPGVKAKVTHKPATGSKRPPDKEFILADAPTSKKGTPRDAAKENAKPVADKSRQGTMGDKCAICQKKVYLLERHIEGGKLYHRSCFRHSELSPTNKVYTRSPFLSPNLSSEPPMSPSHSASDIRSRHASGQSAGDANGGAKISKPEKLVDNKEKASHPHRSHSPPRTKISHDIAATPKKVAGSKHSLAEADRDDSKKSKQSKSLLNVEKIKNVSTIKDRLKNLKAKLDDEKGPAKSNSETRGKSFDVESKSTTSEHLPLSGKEARQLEKRKEELLAAETSVDHVRKGAKRNIPLILQQKELTSPPDSAKKSIHVDDVVHKQRENLTTSTQTGQKAAFSHHLEKSKVSSSASAALSRPKHVSHSSASSSVSSSTVTLKPTTAYDSENRDSPSQNHEHISKKISPKPFDEKCDEKTVLEKTDRANKDKISSLAPPTHPVAKPRKNSSSSSTDKEFESNSVALRNSGAPPKAAPRKSLIETTEKRQPPERPKLPPAIGKSLLTASLDEEGVVLPSPRATSPDSSSEAPPLPLSPPPTLPTSPPPPLPSSSPKGEVPNEKQSTEMSLQDIKASLHPVKKATSNQTNDIKSKHDFRSTENISGTDVTIHGPVKSRVAANTAVVAQTSHKTVHDRKRWSTPSLQDQNLAVFEPSAKKEEDKVLTGLLASLAGVRGRASSTPGISELISTTNDSSSTTSSTPSTSGSKSPSSPAPSSDALKKSSEAKTKSKLPSPPEHAPPAKRDIPALSSNAITSLSSTNKSKNASQNLREVPEALSVLNSLKHVDDLSASATSNRNTSETKDKSENKLAEQKNISSLPEKSVNVNGDDSSSIKSVDFEADKVSLKTRTEERLDKNSVSSFVSKDQPQVNKVKLKKITADVKEVKNEEKKTNVYDLQLKKVDNVETKVEERKSKLYDVQLKKVGDVEMKTEERKANIYDIQLKKVNDVDMKSDDRKINIHDIHTKSIGENDKDKELKSRSEHKMNTSDENEKCDNKFASKGDTKKNNGRITLHRTETDDPKEKSYSQIKTSGSAEQTDQSTPVKPPRPSKVISSKVKISALSQNDELNKTAVNSVFEKDATPEQKLPVSRARTGSYEEDDIPDWKKALEQRKKKLKENIAKSEVEPIDYIAFLRNKDKSRPDRPKSADVLDLVKEQERSRSRRKSREEPAAKNSPRPKSVDVLGKKAVLDLKEDSVGSRYPPGPTRTEGTKASGVQKNDWKSEAEKKMAALGGFDIEDEEKHASATNNSSQPSPKPRRTLPRTPDAPSFTATSKKEKESSGQIGKKAVAKTEAHSRTTTENICPPSSAKEKDKSTSKKPEFLVGLSKLKHVEVDAEKEKSPREDSQISKEISSSKSEDFREKLHQLKQVNGENSASATTVKESRLPKSSETFGPHLTKPLPLMNSSNNSNNIAPAIVTSKKADDHHRSDVNHIEKISAGNGRQPLLDSVALESSPDTSDNEDEEVSKEYKAEDVSAGLQNDASNTATEESSDQISPKLKRKITVIGRNKKEPFDSPEATPKILKKKIEVPVVFDFEQSSEVESSLDVGSSLSDSVSQLSINDSGVSSYRTPPPRPPPPHAHIKPMSPKHISAIELQQQLLDIDSRLTDLELRGRDLEDSIRNVNVMENDEDSMMVEWFNLVSEKNDLVRQEADLVYLSREQDLEDEQEHIESQLRYLIGLSDECKSPAEKEEEDYLIQRKLELVEQRNCIVDSMDEDRLRYEEEDRNIAVMLKGKGLTKDNGTLKALQGKKVARSKFYA